MLLRNVQLPPPGDDRHPGEAAGRAAGPAESVRARSRASGGGAQARGGQGIADFQGIVAGGISSELLKWKAIEVAHELSKSPNAKLILGDKTGLPIIINDK